MKKITLMLVQSFAGRGFQSFFLVKKLAING
jgi:hypothetical protein